MCAVSFGWHYDCHGCLVCVFRRALHSCWSIDMAESSSGRHLRASDVTKLLWQYLFQIRLRRKLMRLLEPRMESCREVLSPDVPLELARIKGRCQR